MSIAVASVDAFAGVAARGAVTHADGEPRDHAFAILPAAFVPGHGMPDLLAFVVAGDADCTGCTT